MSVEIFRANRHRKENKNHRGFYKETAQWFAGLGMQKPLARGKETCRKFLPITFPTAVQRSLDVCPAHLCAEGSSGQCGGRGGANPWEQAVLVRLALTHLENKNRPPKKEICM